MNKWIRQNTLAFLLQSAIMHAENDKRSYVDLLLKHGASVQAQNEMAPSAIQTVILRGRASGSAVTEEELNLVDLFIEYK